MNIYLDDTRPGPTGPRTNPTYGDWSDWVIVRSVSNAKLLLNTGLVNKLSLDHDMGMSIDIIDSKLHATGHDLVKWMCKHNVWPKGEITIHSSNIVGAKNMQSMIDQYRNHKDGV